MRSIVNICILALALMCPQYLWAQGSIQGIVFDKDSRQRIAKVLVRNVQTSANTFNNPRGEFSIVVKVGDQLVAEKEGYYPDTLLITDQKVLLFYLVRSSILIKEVNVVARKSPEEILQQRKKEYNKAFKLADPGSVFSVGQSGAGLSIGSIFNMLSKEGKNARRLTELFQQEYQANVVDSKFTPDMVSSITGLKGLYLKNFMDNYKPSYYFVIAASAYDMTTYVKSKYEMFLLNPNYRNLPALPDIDLDVNIKK